MKHKTRRVRKRDATYYASMVQEEIINCSNEQPLVEGYYLWLSGERSSVGDLVDPYNVPEHLQDEVIAMLRCPKCGATFDSWEDVGTQSSFEITYQDTVEKASAKYYGKLHEFQEFLKAHPSLGARHSLGKQIIRELKEFPSYTVTNEAKWFRARKDLKHGFGPTPAEYADASRYGTAGQPRLYLADSPEGAAAEVIAKCLDLNTTVVHEFSFASKGLRCLDVRPWQAEDDRFFTEEFDYNIPFPLFATAIIFADALTQIPVPSHKGPPEYRLTQFIADAAHQAGFAGIIYPAVRHLGSNLVLMETSIEPTPEGIPFEVTLDGLQIRRAREGLLYLDGKLFDLHDLHLESLAIPNSCVCSGPLF